MSNNPQPHAGPGTSLTGAQSQRAWLTADMAGQAVIEVTAERAASGASGLSLGLPIDDVWVRPWPGSLGTLIATRGQGKTTVSYHIVRESLKQWAAMPPRPDGRQVVTVLAKAEESIDRAHVAIVGHPALNARALMSGKIQAAEARQILSRPEYTGLPLLYVGRVDSPTSIYRTGARRAMAIEDLEEGVDAIAATDRYVIGLLVVDYLQAYVTRAPRMDPIETVAVVSDRLMRLSSRLNAPVIAGAQANVKLLAMRRPSEQMPDIGSTWLTQRWDHDVDWALGIWRPAMSGLNGQFIRVDGEYYRVYLDTFVIRCLAARDSGAAGMQMVCRAAPPPGSPMGWGHMMIQAPADPLEVVAKSRASAAAPVAAPPAAAEQLPLAGAKPARATARKPARSTAAAPAVNGGGRGMPNDPPDAGPEFGPSTDDPNN